MPEVGLQLPHSWAHTCVLHTYICIMHTNTQSQGPGNITRYPTAVSLFGVRLFRWEDTE